MAPSDFQQMNVLDIAIKYELDNFVDNNRVDRIMTHLWEQFDFLNPNVTFRTSELSLWKLLKFLVTSPAKFYYTPLGKYWTASVMYCAYVAVVTYVCLLRNYLHLGHANVEYLMWGCNLGYILYEFTEMALSGYDYWSEMSNIFDTFISINWLTLGFLRFLLPFFVSANYFEMNADNITTTKPNLLANFNAIELVDQESRNKLANEVYMTVFGLQCIVLYFRFLFVFNRSRYLGPFIQMIISMLRDVMKFGFVLLSALCGFSLCVYFLVSTDTLFPCYEVGVPPGSTTDLTALQSSALYVFQTLLGQQDWKDLNSNDCMSPTRSRVLLFLTVVFSMIGNILLLNLLIALMASTYENKRESTSKVVNFTRTEETYSMSLRNALVPPPFNIAVYILTFIFGVISLLVVLFSCKKYFVNISVLQPATVDYRKKKHRHSSRRRRCLLNCQTYLARISFLLSPVNTETGEDSLSIYMNPFDPRGRRFCRFCRFEIKESGDIRDYFALFRKYRLDEDDTRIIARILQGQGICQNCYQPYKIFSDGTSNKVNQWEISLEILSYYVFRACIHIPMILILCLPALVIGITEWFAGLRESSAQKRNKKHDSNTLLVSHTNRHIHDSYRTIVTDVIEEVLESDTDRMREDVIHEISELRGRVESLGSVVSDLGSQFDRIEQFLLRIDRKITVQNSSQFSMLNDETETP
jgi:hypothetical protein